MVLRAVVSAYVADAQPASSGTVSHLLPVPLSSASIRNTMSDLERLGMIEKPHASAGRVPTEIGLRFFVDQLMDSTDLTHYERLTLSNECDSVGAESVVSWVSALLSSRTHQLGFVMSPRVDRMRMRHVSLVRVATDRLLIVLVPEVGPVQQHVMHERGQSDQADLDAMAARLTERLLGRTLLELRNLLETELSRLRDEAQGLLARALSLGLRVLDQPSVRELELVVTNHTALLTQPEFHDPDRLRGILRAVEDNERLLEVVGKILESSGSAVSVSLGDDLEGANLRECALVAVPYGRAGQAAGGDDKSPDAQGESALGALGVIGPNRMDYARVISLVGFCSELVTAKLDSGDQAQG
ncbi:MAG: heat-inducible transcriptional repressor HrcA [Myxococcota bacterium]|nr:heat-inducible transcriptional repressor HrcA [Myxococcota bacterium]